MKGALPKCELMQKDVPNKFIKLEETKNEYLITDHDYVKINRNYDEVKS